MNNPTKTRVATQDPNQLNIFNSPQEAENWVTRNPPMGIMVLLSEEVVMTTDPTVLQNQTDEERASLPHDIACVLVLPNGETSPPVKFVRDSFSSLKEAENALDQLQKSKSKEEADAIVKANELALNFYYDSTEAFPVMEKGVWACSLVMATVFGSKDNFVIFPIASFTAEFESKETAEEQVRLFNQTKANCSQVCSAYVIRSSST